jgi:hypothetical protein
VDAVAGGGRDRVAPDGIDDLVDLHDLVHPAGQQAQDGALLGRAWRHLGLVPPDPHPTEQLQPH